MAVSRKDYLHFGGSTSCYMVQAGQQTVFLDAGTGLLSAPVSFLRPPVILLSHLHLDHLLGLGMYPRLSQNGKETFIYLPAGEQGADSRLDGLYAPPYWPLSLCGYAGTQQIGELVFPMQLGDITVEGIQGNHPGGCWVMRLCCGGRKLVYATDYEPAEPSFSELISFAENADLLLYDGQYTQEEYEQRKGFGHSTAEKGIEVMERSGAKRLLLIHLDPQHTDRFLLEREKKIGCERVSFAREGEEIVI